MSSDPNNDNNDNNNTDKNFFDYAHKNVNFKHINVNKRITGIPDPHTAISSTTFHAAESTASLCKQANVFLAPAAIAIDAVRVGASAMDDYKKGTIRNTVTTVSSIGGAWGGGLAGAEAGAAIGSMIMPGIGTIAGAILGGISGGIGGAAAAEKITDVVADKVEISIEHLQCLICEENFECRLYTDQNHEFCPECIKKQQATQSLECLLCQENFDCLIFTVQSQVLCPNCIKTVLSLPPLHDQCRELCSECIGGLLSVEPLQCQICYEMFNCKANTDQCRELCPKCVKGVQSGEIEILEVEGSDEEEWFDPQ